MATRNSTRPTTPNVRISHNVGPTSPPQTPTTASPLLNRGKHGQPSPKSRHLPPFQNLSRPAVPSRSNIQPLGNGPHFSYKRPIRPEELSPRSSSSGDEDDDSESSGSGSPPRSSSHEDNEVEDEDVDEEGDEDDESEDEDEEGNGLLKPPPPIRARFTAVCSFTVEEMSDFDPMDSGNERLNMIRPHAFEYPESDRSRSRSRNPPELDKYMIRGMQDLNCSNSSDEDIPNHDLEEFIKRQKQIKMQKRRSHGSSIGKRTHSERGDSDRDDLESVEWNEEGSMTRRTRRKVGERWSVQFAEHPQPPILEEDEVLADDEVIIDGRTLFRELPYDMEIDSS